MRLFRIVISVLFCIVLSVFAFMYIRDHYIADRSYPVITVESDMLEVPVDADKAQLLKGVTASDAKDGDLTDKVIVESISKFSEKGVCKVTYSVCDSDNYVGSATRKIRYKGYTSPKIGLNAPMCFPLGVTVDLREVLCATDVIDGDISRNIIYSSSDYETGKTGRFTVDVLVTNSKGDTVQTQLPLIIEERTSNADTINLKDYLIYIKKGQKVDYRKYIQNVITSSGEASEAEVTVDSEVNPNKPGIYLVHFYTGEEDSFRRAHSILTVVVKG